jgi:hypothetical protein
VHWKVVVVMSALLFLYAAVGGVSRGAGAGGVGGAGVTLLVLGCYFWLVVVVFCLC